MEASSQTVAIDHLLCRLSVILDSSEDPTPLLDIFTSDATVIVGSSVVVDARVWFASMRRLQEMSMLVGRHVCSPAHIAIAPDGETCISKQYFDHTCRLGSQAVSMAGMNIDHLVKVGAGDADWRIASRRCVRLPEDAVHHFVQDAPRKQHYLSLKQGHDHALSVVGASLAVAAGDGDLAEMPRVQQLLSMYSHLLDRFQLDEMVRTVFHEKASVQTGKVAAVGWEDIRESFEVYKQRFEEGSGKCWLRHKVTTPLVRVLPAGVDGGQGSNQRYAESVAYYEAEIFEVDTGKCFVTVGRYQDKLIKSPGGGWLILHRVTNTTDVYPFQSPPELRPTPERILPEWAKRPTTIWHNSWSRVPLPSVAQATIHTSADDIVQINQLLARRCILADNFGGRPEACEQGLEELYGVQGCFTGEGENVTISQVDWETQLIRSTWPSRPAQTADVFPRLAAARHKLTTVVACVDEGGSTATAHCYLDHDDKHGVRTSGKCEFRCVKICGRWLIKDCITFVCPLSFLFSTTSPVSEVARL